MKAILETKEFKNLSSLKRNCIYSYIMLTLREMTINQLCEKFDVSRNLLCAWAKEGKILYNN
jgi:hypothetical protein